MNTITHENIRLFIESAELKGAQSVSVSSEVSIEPVVCLGTGFLGLEESGPPNSSITATRIIVDDANYWSLNNLSGAFYYKNNETSRRVAWSDSRITSLNIECSINSFIEESVTLKVYDDLTKLEIAQPTYVEPDTTKIPKPGFIQSNLPFKDDNAIQSISYSVTPNWREQYFIGDRVPELELVLPVAVTLDVSALIIDYELDTFEDLCALQKHDVQIIFKDGCLDRTIKTITANNMLLNKFQIEGRVGDRLSIQLSYAGYYNSADGLI